MAVAVLLASALSLACGFILARSVGGDSGTALALSGAVAVGLVTLQFTLHAFLILRSAFTDNVATERGSESATRNRQLELLTRLADMLDREVRYRRIITRAIDFFAEELGASSVVYWRPGVDREPAAPYMARLPDAARVHGPLKTPHRAVVTRHSSRELRPIYLHGPKSQPRHLDPMSPPPAPVHLFIPLAGRDASEGLLEVTVGAPGWDAATWALLDRIAAWVGAAVERGRKYEEVRERADTDYVTGVFSHRFMQNYLSRVLSASTVRRRPVTVLLLDVDGFKTLNDSLGHGAGDKVLATVARLLRQFAGKSGIVGRCGGDEFIVILPDQSRDEAEAFKEKVADWLATDAAILDGGLRIGMSCGWAVFPHDATNRQELLAVADARLYRAKARGHGVTAHSESRAERTTVGVYGVLDRILDTMQDRDQFTREHAETTAEYAVGLAQELGLSTSAQRILRLAGLLHDIGKIGLPPGLMDGSEGGEIARLEHQLELAEHLIADVPDAPEVRRLIRDHHERWDGGGYPSGARGVSIPYLARILAVADSFSVITLRRPDLSPPEAYERLQQEAARRLDPELVRVFFRVLHRRHDRDETYLEARIP
jgi:diguanylate cyclase (GGDEF)-like protein